MKKFVCTVCGYVYEGEELPEDYEYPLHHHKIKNHNQLI